MSCERLTSCGMGWWRRSCAPPVRRSTKAWSTKSSRRVPMSVGVAIAGALIWWRPSLRLADPIMTLVFAVLVVLTTCSLVRDLFNILSERAPRGLETPAIEKALNAVPGVACVHDVHCWQLSPSTPALVTAHVTRRAGSDASVVLAAATAALAAMGLEHATLQIATAEEDAACAVARRKAAELAAAGAAGAV